MEDFNIFVIHWKIWFLEGVHEKPIYWGKLPKKGGLDSLQIYGWAGKKEGVVFLNGVDTSMYTMSISMTEVIIISIL